MSEKIALQFRNYNPDVLTCIANLSNDEVFTPPEFANRMLDTLEQAWAEANGGARIWANPDVTFLDPFTKSGVFLREITRRLTDGLAEQIPDLQERVDHILTKQVYGIAITRLTSLLARRSLYCSKWANGPHSIARSFDTEEGNIWFERTEHTWSGRRLNHALLDAAGNPVVEGRRCRYCGAAERAYARDMDLETHAYAFIHTDDIKARLAELFGADMQFDVIIGNPPYQLSDETMAESSTRIASASPIYQEFVEQAKRLEPRFLSMIIPSRWMAGGRGLDQFRRTMLADHSLTELVDYPDATDVFGPGVRVSGGVCYFLRERGRTGRTRVTTVRGSNHVGPFERALDEYDVFIRDSEAVDIVHRVMAGGGRTVSSMFDPGWGLETNFRDHIEVPGQGDLVLHINASGMGHQRATRFVSRSRVLRGRDLIDRWKVLVPSAAGYGAEQAFDRVLGEPIIAGPGEVGTQTYRVIGPFESEEQARSFVSYYATKFFRFLVSLRKVTQHASPSVYAWVPVQSWDREWSDLELFETYSVTNAEQAYIASRIREVDWGVLG